MDQYREYFDDRLRQSGCVYCGGYADTREHVPSKVFLEEPYPENLPVVGACKSCNNGFSEDEAYVACLLGAAIGGTADPNEKMRPSAARLLRRWPSLRERIEKTQFIHEGAVAFGVEIERLNGVLVKLARGHVLFELGKMLRGSPTALFWRLRHQMTREEQEEFDSLEVVGPLNEIGTRQTQRLMVLEIGMQSPLGEKKSHGLVVNDWLDVQEENYRYQVRESSDAVEVRIVIWEYLVAQVSWGLMD